MRLLIPTLLVFILGACPILCGTGGAMLGLQGHEHAAGHPGDAPVNDDDCLCNGAIGVSATGTTLAVDALSAPFAAILAPFAAVPPPTLALVALRADVATPCAARRHDLLQSCRC